MQMLEITNKELSLSAQCRLLGLCRTGFYYKPLINNDSELANLIREIYIDSDCRYGYRKIVGGLKEKHLVVNHKRVLRIMHDMGIQGLYPRRTINTTIKANHAIYPYLLDGLNITRPNQAWATDLTYIKVSGRFMYFMAIIDLFSRYIITYELSNSLEAGFCVNTLKQALSTGIPEIFNTDQGSQFTCHDFISVLKFAGIKISMDHKGRCFDNILVERLWRTLKQEAIYYYRPETVAELGKCIDEFVLWYNNSRLHQSLNYLTPKHVYMGTVSMH